MIQRLVSEQHCCEVPWGPPKCHRKGARMGLWVDLQYYVLRKAYPRSSNPLPEKITDHSKLSLLGAGLQSAIRGKIVIDPHA